MGTRIWFRTDIANAIRAAEAICRRTCEALGPAPGAYGEGFQAGFQAALSGLAAAFGLRVESLPAEVISLHRRGEEDRWQP
ncbi:MAG: hypothetical protein ACUVXG_08360 [Anaerolineae bacterium]